MDTDRPRTLLSIQYLRGLAAEAWHRLGARITYAPACLPRPVSAISQEGYQAHKDGTLVTACPYVRQAQADEWRHGWDEAEMAVWAW